MNWAELLNIYYNYSSNTSFMIKLLRVCLRYKIKDIKIPHVAFICTNSGKVEVINVILKKCFVDVF